MTDDETIARIALFVSHGEHISPFDSNILLGQIGLLKASNEMAAEHIAKAREYTTRLESELDALKADRREEHEQYLAEESSNTLPEPRTEMRCLACGGFSSTRYCHHCATAPVATRAVIADLEARIRKIEQFLVIP